MKTLSLAISDFAVPSPRSGSIEAYSGYGSLPNLGVEIHQEIQTRRQKEHPGYQAEKWVTHTFTQEKFKIQVNGRCDGFSYGPPAWIEEIKSAHNAQELLKALAANPDHPYRLQLRTYGYIHYRLHREEPQLNLLIVSARDRSEIDFPLELDVAGYESWLKRRLSELADEGKMFEALKKRRRKLAQEFTFPFSEPRQGQIELMRTVEENLNKNTRQLLQAPTGLGKTAGILFPALKEALGRGQKVIYLTPKNSQHAVAEDAVKRLQESGSKIRSATIQAKAKICLKDQVLCNPEYCEYARDHYSKVAEKQLVEKVAVKKNQSTLALQKIARQHQVCPFELQMQSLHRADVVIADYNYVFSPRNSLGRLTYNGFEKKSAPNLVVDEAHNLPARAAEYFSASLSSAKLREIQKGLQHLPPELYSQAQDLVHDALDFIDSANPSPRPALVEVEAERFLKLSARAGELFARYMESGGEAARENDGVVDLQNLFSDFAQALENRNEDFFCTHTPGPRGGNLRITCCDASPWLKESYTAFANVVTFSATLKPFEYYTRLLGFADGPHLTAEFSSPFPREHRKVLLIPQVSTKYSDREANYSKIADGIQRIVQIRPGNYFVFFPSFEFLGRVSSLLSLPQFKILAQTREMKRPEIADYIEILKQRAQPTLILAVQGGVFAEGVDYPGEMLIGAIIVGPALPTFDFERECLRAHYEKKHGEEHGFDYAYTYPAMAKVVQSAGRVIRSHHDRGLIVLMDRRFLQSNYVKSMPADWVGDEPLQHVSSSLLKDIQKFWDDNASS